MARLYASLEELQARLGRDFIAELTYPGIYRGAPLSVAPVLIERDGVRTVVVSEADSDAGKTLPAGVGMAVYGRYFSWDKDMSRTPADFATVVREVAGSAPIEAQATLPVSRYRQLLSTGPVELFDREMDQPIHVYSKSRAELEAQWIATRDADAKRFAPFVAELAQGETLVAAMTARSAGFEPLAALCASAGLGALYVTAPHEVEMFSGLPATVNAQFGISALFRPDQAHVTVFSAAPMARGDFVAEAERPSLADALRALASGPIGVQQDHLSADAYPRLEAAGLPIADGAYVLRRWQDLRASDDLVYFIFAAHAALAGIDAARAFFARAGASGALIERDLVAIYHQGVDRFAAEHGFAGRVSSYFDIVHSGARTLLPATAAKYPVGPADKTIKFDMGLIVADGYGCARACSDIARTLCADPEIARLHDNLRALLIERLIPAIQPGMTGAEAHAAGVDCLRKLEPELRRLRLLPEGRGVEGYVRDCGHTIQRQTISSVYFLTGVRERIEPGMLGCVEFVWPIGEILIAVEDSYFVTPTGAIPFTLEGARC